MSPTGSSSASPQRRRSAGPHPLVVAWALRLVRYSSATWLAVSVGSITGIAVIAAVAGGRSPSVRVAAVLILGAALMATIGVVRALSARLDYNQVIVESAQDWLNHDQLTGALDRDGTRLVIRRVLNRSRPGSGLVAVVIAHIDQLAAVNESLGYHGGNQVLEVLYSRLSTLTGVEEVGRSRGGEFVVVADGLPTGDDVERLVVAAETVIDEPIEIDTGGTIRVAASIGASAWTPSTDPHRPTPEELLRQADLALVEVRERGGGIQIFNSELGERAVARLDLEQQLRQALDEGSIGVHYQPVVDAVTLNVLIVEALIRWEHPERGTIHPGDFLPVAARSRLVVDLGQQVLSQALAQAALWRSRGRPVGVSVNLNARQLADVGLVGRIDRLVERAGVDHATLQVEVAEDQLFGLDDSTLASLGELRARGVRFAIDEFGANQASLGALRRGPGPRTSPSGPNLISSIKLDRALVENLATSPIDYQVVAAIAGLAREAGMTIIASGVETIDQSRVLTGLGIEAQQGFLYARPSPAADLDPILGLSSVQAYWGGSTTPESAAAADAASDSWV